MTRDAVALAYGSIFVVVMKRATASGRKGALHGVGGTSGINNNNRTSKIDNSDKEESSNEGFTAGSTHSVDASEPKLTPASIPQG